MKESLNFKIFGAGSPVIILHGFLGSLDNWQSFAKQLSKDYMVITVDQRNHGKSPHTSDFSYELMCEDLLHLMETEWIHNASFIGHSMGGKTVMKMALDHPDVVDKLFVIDIAPRKYPKRHDLILEALQKVSINSIKTRKEAETVLLESISEIGVVQFLLKNLKRRNDGFYWQMNLPVLSKCYQNILEEITGPAVDKEVYFLRGSNSNYVLDEDLELILKLFPKAVLEMIEDAGHWVHADAPVALLDSIRNHLSA